MEEMPYRARRYLNQPKAVMNLVRSWLSALSGHWWYILRASNFVKTLAFSAAISATACAGVGHWYHPDLVGSFFVGNYNRGTPFSRFGDRCNDVLLQEEL